VVTMTAFDDYCDLCELPKSQCIHGQPPPAPKPVTEVLPRPRARAAAKPRTPGVAAKPVTRRWTPPETFKPLIVAVLRDAGGELSAGELFVQLELRAGDRLRLADRETTPEGEPRWQYAARRARQTLINDGLMTKGRAGIWQLTEAGRESG
jgi:Mrr N-terminal domain